MVDARRLVDGHCGLGSFHELTLVVGVSTIRVSGWEPEAAREASLSSFADAEGTDCAP